MKKFKKAMALTLAMAMGLSLVACGDKKSEEGDKEETKKTEETGEGDTTDADSTGEATGEGPAGLTLPAEDSAVINVYSWNTELGDRLNYFYDKYPQYKELVNYVNLGVGGTSDEYKSGIENAITNGGDTYPGIIAADNDVALYFLDSDEMVAMSDLGITADMYSNAFQYTVDYATIGGELKGLTWQAAPGCFVYRTDIAEEVFGTSEPEEIQKYVETWDKFWETCETLKSKDIAMLSGPDDIKYVMMDQRTNAWYDADYNLSIDACVTDYLEMAKKLYDNGYTKQSSMWSDAWNLNFTEDVFGYFGCTWFVYWCIPNGGLADAYLADCEAKGEEPDPAVLEIKEKTDAQAPALAGKRHMCQGPAAYHWGGTYLGVTKDCPNKELAALILYTLCCDTEVMAKLSEETLDFVNNTAAVDQLIAEGKGASDVLGGQNPLETWKAAAEKIKLDKATALDSTLNGYLDTASAAYNAGTHATVDDAVDSIKDLVKETYQYINVE